MAEPTVYNPRKILAALTVALGIQPFELSTGRRTLYRTSARQAAAYLLYRTRILSYSDVAALLKYADHACATAAARQARTRMDRDPRYADLIRSLEVQLGLPVTGQEHAGTTTIDDWRGPTHATIDDPTPKEG